MSSTYPAAVTHRALSINGARGAFFASLGDFEGGVTGGSGRQGSSSNPPCSFIGAHSDRSRGPTAIVSPGRDPDEFVAARSP